MKTFLKYFLIFILILGLLLIGMLSTADVNKYKPVFEEQLSNVWGMDVFIQGPMQMHFFPNPDVNLKDVKIQRELKKDKTLIITIDDLFLEMTWDSFYENKMTIKALDAKEISVNYVENLKPMHTLEINEMSAEMISTFQHLRLPTFAATTENVKIQGDLDMSFERDKLNISGNLKLPSYQVLLPADKIEQSLRDFLKNLNPYLNLHEINADLTIMIDKLQFLDKTMNNAKFEIDLKNKVLKVNYAAKESNHDYKRKVILPVVLQQS